MCLPSMVANDGQWRLTGVKWGAWGVYGVYGRQLRSLSTKENEDQLGQVGQPNLNKPKPLL